MKKKGFTLIELLVVIAILAVILLIAVPIIVGNIDKSKVKSYDNQVALFIEGAKRLALEYNNDLVWVDTEVKGVQKTTITLRELAEKDYADLPVINPKTGEPFDPDKTLITITKNKDGSYDFEPDMGDSTGFKLIVGSKIQTIARSTIYDTRMIMADVYGSDDDGKDITNTITYTCKYKEESIDCNTLSSTTKEIGTYYITYSLISNTKTKTETRTIKVLESSRPIIEVRPIDDGVTKVDKVRVTIIYPEGSKSRTYGTKYGTNKTYVMGFDVNENQTITADCIDKNGLKCETATEDIRHIKIAVPTITSSYSPSVAKNGYYKQGVVRVIFRDKAVKGEQYFIRTTKIGDCSVAVTEVCGTGNLPGACSTIPSTTTLNENTWYKVSEKINVTYSRTSPSIGSIKAVIWSSTVYGEVVEKNIEKIDVSGPVISISGNPSNWTTSTILKIEANDNGAGLDTNAYSFDNGITWTSNNTSKTYTTNGTINIKVKDKLGNIAQQSVAITKIDTKSPTITRVDGNPSSWTTSARLTIVASDNESGLHEQPYSFDNGATWTSNNTSKTYTTNGTITIKVRDKVGKVSTKSVTISKIDTTKPIVAIGTVTADVTSIIISGINSTDSQSGISSLYVAFGTSSNNYNLGIKCQTHSPVGTTNAEISSCNITGLTENKTYYYQVCAVDHAGNTSTCKKDSVETVDPISVCKLETQKYIPKCSSCPNEACAKECTYDSKKRAYEECCTRLTGNSTCGLTCPKGETLSFNLNIMAYECAKDSGGSSGDSSSGVCGCSPYSCSCGVNKSCSGSWGMPNMVCYEYDVTYSYSWCENKVINGVSHVCSCSTTCSMH